jgi:hypothetical protein
MELRKEKKWRESFKGIMRREERGGRRNCFIFRLNIDLAGWREETIITMRQSITYIAAAAATAK